MLEHLPTLLTLTIALSTLWAARLTRPDRNYWPMLRVIWGVLGAVYFGSFWNNVQGQRGGLTVRLAFLAATQIAILYAVWFMRRRNRTARYIALTVDGHEVTLPLEEYERMANVVASLLDHGAMGAADAAKLRAALAEWDRKQTWRTDLARQTADRKAKKGDTR